MKLLLRVMSTLKMLEQLSRLSLSLAYLKETKVSKAQREILAQLVVVAVTF